MNGNVTILTPFRNSEWYIPKYIEQAKTLDWPPDCLRWSLVEGDSEDNTLSLLSEWAVSDKRVTLSKCDTGKPHYGSVVHPERFEILCQVYNTALEAAIQDDWADWLMFVPSDVLYRSDMLIKLMSWERDVISPMFWIGPHEGDVNPHAEGLRFYDIWGFKDTNGQHFGPYGPAWYKARLPEQPILMTTTGGVMLFRAEIAQQGARYTEKDVDHGLCITAREMGYSVWCDPTTHIVHGKR